MEIIEPAPRWATAVAFVGQRLYLLRLEARQLRIRDAGDLITAQVLEVIPTPESID